MSDELVHNETKTYWPLAFAVRGTVYLSLYGAKRQLVFLLPNKLHNNKRCSPVDTGKHISVDTHINIYVREANSEHAAVKVINSNVLLHLCPVATALRQAHLLQGAHTDTHPYVPQTTKKTKAGRGWRLAAMSSIRKGCKASVFPVYFITAIMIQHLFFLMCDQPALHRR